MDGILLNLNNYSYCIQPNAFFFFGRRITTLIIAENGPSLKKIPTSFRYKDERICWYFIFDVALNLNCTYE